MPTKVEPVARHVDLPRHGAPIARFHKGMKGYFGIPRPQDFLDMEMAQLRWVHIDLLKFDEWLHGVVGNYEEDEGLSMEEALDKYYGVEATNFIKSLI